jgi:hypothetical protein
MELRAKIRELVKAGRTQSMPARVRASSKKKASPRQERTPMDEEQAALVASVFQSNIMYRVGTIIEVGPAWRAWQNL